MITHYLWSNYVYFVFFRLAYAFFSITHSTYPQRWNMTTFPPADLHVLFEHSRAELLLKCINFFSWLWMCYGQIDNYRYFRSHNHSYCVKLNKMPSPHSKFRVLLLFLDDQDTFIFLCEKLTKLKASDFC